MMKTVEPPYLYLWQRGREWAPGIQFTSSRERSEFVRLADWLVCEFGAEVVERRGGQSPEDKEYWTLRSAGSQWLLSRCYYPRGIDLAGEHVADLPAFEAIAREVGARPFGWRYRWFRFRSWLIGKMG